ncbi:hypothetical protein KY342_00005 [Candidatus Woesearchaeota archaeon]|nr:hypothetical protein [Candidatus Woesearchaeota archaeon]
MSKINSLKDYLSAKLEAPSGHGFSFSEWVKNAADVVRDQDKYDQSAGLAALMDAEDAELHEENFSIRPIPSGRENDIVEAVKEFYEAHGFKYNEEYSNLRWWATLCFEKDGEGSQVTLSTYPIIDTDQEELLVTSDVSLRKK